MSTTKSIPLLLWSILITIAFTISCGSGSKDASRDKTCDPSTADCGDNKVPDDDGYSTFRIHFSDKDANLIRISIAMKDGSERPTLTEVQSDASEIPLDPKAITDEYKQGLSFDDISVETNRIELDLTEKAKTGLDLKIKVQHDNLILFYFDMNGESLSSNFDELSECTNLLDFWHSNYGSNPIIGWDHIKNLSSLRSINLITNKQKVEIGDSGFTKLNNLMYLVFNNIGIDESYFGMMDNLIQSLPKLRTLYLYGTSIKGTLSAQMFSGLPELRDLSLYYNNELNGKLPSEFLKGTSLRTFVFNGNSTQGTLIPGDLLSYSPNLSTMSFSLSGVAALPSNMFSATPQLKAISLYSMDLTAIPTLPVKANNLYLTYNKFNSTTVDGIIKTLATNAQNYNVTNGSLYISNQNPHAKPSASSSSDIDKLKNLGWTLQTD